MHGACEYEKNSIKPQLKPDIPVFFMGYGETITQVEINDVTPRSGCFENDAAKPAQARLRAQVSEH